MLSFLDGPHGSHCIAIFISLFCVGEIVEGHARIGRITASFSLNEYFNSPAAVGVAVVKAGLIKV